MKTTVCLSMFVATVGLLTQSVPLVFGPAILNAALAAYVWRR